MFCKDCKGTTHFLVDGCNVADRLLEGVLFRVDIEDDASEFLVRLHNEDDREYFDTFKSSPEKWYLDIRDYVGGLVDQGLCPNCDACVDQED